MGMDGLSMASTGALKEATSAELSTRTEQAVQTDASTNINQVQVLNANRAVKEREEEEQQGQERNRKRDNRDEEFQDGLVEDDSSEQENQILVEENDDINKDFYVKLNPKDDIIELYEKNTNRLIETISGSELQELVKKMNMASGIFINKRV